MSLSKKKILMNSFFNSQFSYCPLIWMFHSRIMNNKINRLHERCMRLIYEDKTSSFEELLEQDKSVSIGTCKWTLQTLGTCKSWPKKCLKCIEVCLLLFSVNYFVDEISVIIYLRKNSNFAVPNVKSVFHGSESISYLGPKLWDIVCLELKEWTGLNAFNNGMKKWRTKNCLCRLCKQYVLNLGSTSNTSETCF